MKKALSMLLVLVMLIGMVPMTAFATEGTVVIETTEVFSITMELSGVSSDMVSSGTSEDTRYYAACGDSITHANHALVTDIDADDEYYPIDGYSGTTYARKNYAYYIAQRNNLQWANYGYGGTTLHHCYPKGYGGSSMRTFPFVDERITQLKEGVEWDYISLFFGYNDVIYGPAQQRDFWLTETYGEELGYPVYDSQIGTEGFANAEQKAACDAVTGSVGGVEYTDNTEYFFAKFVGTVDDTETTTFLGAYNYALDYLTKKYPNAKILIVNPYVGGTNNTRKIIRDGVNAVAEKWGVSCMDFSDLSYWFYGVDQKRVEFPNPHREDGRWYAENGKANYAGTVEGYNRARFTTDGTHPSNLGYQTISKPIERALIDSDNTVNVLQGESFETELILDDVYTGMDVSVTMDGTDITDQCYANGKIRIESVTGNVIIRANGNITYTDGHTYFAEITAPTCTEQGYTTYTCDCGESYVGDYVDATGHSYENGICTGCGVANWDTDGDGVLEILAIGNSFSVDALEYAYQIAQNLGIQEIVLGNLYIGGCTLATHAANAAGDLGKYTYYYNDSGTWTSTGSYKISTALESRSWDYVSMQQGSPVSGVESSYNEDLDNLIAYVQERSDAKLVWHMTWAYQQNSTHSAFPTYGSDQMTMYNAIVSAVQNKIITNENFDLIVPNGTAVQNSRTSLLGDTTTRDGYHMSYDYGRYLTGLLFIKTVTGMSVDNITYAPSGVDAEEKQIAIESVKNAYRTPYAVTESVYQKEEVVIPEGYVEQNLGLTALGYWNSSDKTGLHNQVITDASNSKQFYCTVQFTRDQLPVGSVILLADGWQYRPEGWVTDAVNTNRPATTTESYVVITEEWWGNCTLRAFNISKVGLPSLSSVSEEDICEAFRIYVPASAHIHTYTDLTTAPTCTEQGYTTYTCTCGDSYVGDYVDATGHSYKNGTCTVCGPAQPGPVITKQPESVEAAIGEKFAVTVEAEGEGLTYQWYFKDAGATEFTKSSMRTDVYSFEMTKARNGRQVYCVITDDYGNEVTTDTVTITRIPAAELAILTQPQDTDAVLGETFAVTVEAQGEGLTYQWYFKDAGATEFTKSSMRTDVYSFEMTKARNGRQVYCVITDDFGNEVTTDTVTITRIPAVQLAILTQPSDTSAALGETFATTVVAQGEELKYQWYFKDVNDTEFHKSCLRTDTYTWPMVKFRAGRQVYCVITDAFGNTVTTDTVTITRVPAAELAILTQPQDTDAVLGETFAVSVEAEGEGLKYQWYFKDAGATGFTKSSMRTDVYSFEMTKARNGRQVYCVITDDFGNEVTTDTVTITRVPAAELAILTQPQDTSAALGEIFAVSVEAEGEGLKYQWYFKDAGATGFTKSSMRTDVYSFEMTKARNGRQVYCVITDDFGNEVTTDVAVLKEKADIVVDAFPDISQFLAAQTSSQTSVGAAQLANVNLYPIFYNTNTAYANSKLRSVDIPVKTVSSLTEGQTITLYVADSSILNTTDMSAFLASDAVRAYTIVVDVTEYSSTTIRDSVTVDLSGYDIFVGENELIGFGSAEDTVAWTLLSTRQTSPEIHEEMYLSYTYGNKLVSGGIHYSMLFNFEIEVSDDRVTDGESGDGESGDGDSGDEDLETEVPDEGGDASDVPEDYSGLEGLKLSILGDSISTYKGYSNDAANTNSTIGSNNVYYNGKNGLTGVEDTWWMQTVNDTGMNLLVNNSWSGSYVVGALDSVDAGVGNRAENLHDNTGDNAGTLPDVIAVYMGTNDLSKKVGDYTSAGFYDNLYVDSDGDGVYDDPTTFAHAYAIMLDKITKAYPEAEIFTFTILANNWVNASVNEKINAAIQEISAHYGATVVDIYAETGITAANAGEYMLDNEKTHIHPNEAGMDLIAEAFKKALLEKFQGQ